MSQLKYYFCLSFVILLNISNAQQNDTILIQQTDSIYKTNKKVPKEGLKALDMLLQQQDTLRSSEGIANIYHKKGLFYERIARASKNNLYDNKAINEYKTAIKIRKKISPVNIKKVNNSLYNTSNCYNRIGDLEKKKSILETIINSNSTDKFVYKAYDKLAYTNVAIGDYYIALQHLNKIIHSYSIHKNAKIVYKAHVTAIYVYVEKNDYVKDLDIINYHKDQIEGLLNTHENLKRIIDVYNNLAIVYKDLGLYNEASQVYKNTLSEFKKLNDSAKVATLNLNLGELYSLQGLQKEAYIYYDEALKIVKYNLTESLIYTNQGSYLNTKQSKERLPYFEKAIQTLFNYENTTSKFELPSLELLKLTPHKSYALVHLTELANTLVKSFEEEKDIIYLNRAKSTLYKIDQLVSLMRYDSSSEKSKLFWINKGVDLYMLAVKVCYLLNQPEDAFYFMEKNKALLLLENINSSQEKERLKIPDSILQREFNLRYTILDTEDKLNKTPNDKSLAKIYLEQENNYNQFLNTLKTEYPTYFNTKKEPTILSLKEAKTKHTATNANYIEYILNDTSGYGIFSTHENTTLFEIKEVPTLLNELDSLKRLISKPIVYTKDSKAYNSIALSVFKKLFPFKNALQQLSNKKLTVIPDYKLRNLPFEALVTSLNEKNTSYNYLIQDIEVSYYQSASVFKQIEQKQRAAKKDLIGFAPVTFNTDSLPSLKGSTLEMDAISNLIPSTLRLNKEASKTAFISSLNDYNIIHINTHAGLDKDNNPWIAFSDDKMTLKELYGTTNQANLVILDACKSATGALEKGEGVMSLSRGFFYGGAQSVIASQWNVNQQSNNEILISFYNNLKKGQTKSSALHQAKLNYLKNHQSSELSPYFWSSLTLTGDPSAVQFQESSYLLFVVISVLIIVLLLFFFKIKNRKT